MLKELLKNKKFSKIAEKISNEGKVIDIILFGSIVRGKDKPGDIDLLLIYPFKDDSDYSYEVKKRFEKDGFKVHISGIAYEKLFSSNFLARESVLSEGYSFKHKEFLSLAFGFSSFVIFRYYLNGLNDSERMKFYYSLYGRRNEKGVLKIFESIKFSDRVILTHISQDENIKEFFDKKKIRYDKIPILLPTRLASRRFLGVK